MSGQGFMSCEGVMMGNEIAVSKTTALLLAGLFLAIVVGGYVVFGASGSAGTTRSGGPDVSGSQAQDVYIKALGTGSYDNPQVTVKRGIPVRLHFSTDGHAGCGSALYLDAFNVKLVSSGEEEVAQFTPEQDGTFPYHCGMNMFRGRMIVTG
jgi:cupredoxin-like protein